MHKKQVHTFFAVVFILSLPDIGIAAEKGERTEVEMHHPKGWQFTLPKGDPVKGRAVFDKFSCYSCHEVRGEKFPPLDKNQAVGPELSQMGPMHPLEYFTESIINPSAVGMKKYRGPDGKSKMPDFNSDMTVQELIDVSAYLASLKPKGVAKFVTGEGKVLAVVPGEPRNYCRTRRDQRLYGCNDNGIQGQSDLSVEDSQGRRQNSLHHRYR